MENMKVKEIIIDTLSKQLSIPREEITLECSLTRDLGADSLDMCEIETELEDRFGVNNGIHASDNFSYNSTVQELIDYVWDRLYELIPDYMKEEKE